MLLCLQSITYSASLNLPNLVCKEKENNLGALTFFSDHYAVIIRVLMCFLTRSFWLNRLPSVRHGEHQVFPPPRHAYLSDVVPAVFATDGFDCAHVQPSKDLWAGVNPLLVPVGEKSSIRSTTKEPRGAEGKTDNHNPDGYLCRTCNKQSDMLLLHRSESEVEFLSDCRGWNIYWSILLVRPSEAK